MAKHCSYVYFTVTFFLIILAPQSRAHTDPLDIAALRNLYKKLNNPPQLKGWRMDGGDPCQELWTGVSCSGSSVIYLKLQGLNVSGSLGNHLSDLHSLKHLDISYNNIGGEIPSALPLNVTHINMACNYLSQSIPHALSLLKHVRLLNLSHNALSGPIGNVFTGLQGLKEMDLSFNNFTGDLPSSFGSLTSLTRLFLQGNRFTGSVVYLANLPLTDLNIQENHFSGVLPRHFQSIPNLWIGGNKFHAGGDYPPWNFPMQTVPIPQNISSPPTTQSSAIESHPSLTAGGRKKKKVGPGGIASMVGGATLVATCAAVFIIIRIHQSRAQKDKSLQRDNNISTLDSLPISTARDYSTAPDESSQTFTVGSLIPGARHVHFVHHTRDEKQSRRSFSHHSKKCKTPTSAKVFTVAELQLATNSFSEENLLGEGSLGSVYKAEFPDIQIFVVKNINMVPLSFQEEEQFLDVVRTASRLRHPNIVPLVGYCIEHGQHLLVYEYIRNLSLDDALHCDSYQLLSWEIRLQIALDIAQALDYMHSVFSPPVAHSNIKAANILLDEELRPHICDCGIAVLKPLTSNSVKLKASEIAIGDTGYISPEHGQPGADNRKSDIYAFGVLLLELLTGRRPFDSCRPREEQSLVKWASSRLHDGECLEQMVDPAIKSTFSSRTLSRFADVISFCIQPEKEFRPPMSQIVESLTYLSQMLSDAADSSEVDHFERSFRSSYTRFIGSPTLQ